MALSERMIQRAVMDYLKTRKDVYFFRAGSGHVKLQSGRHFKTGSPGVPDIVCLYNGRFIGLEVKAVSGKQSALQVEAEQKIKNAGGEYYIVRCMDDLFKALSSHGVK